MPLFAKISIDKKQLEAAIARLERQTSAEFRIFIERKIPSKPTALCASVIGNIYSNIAQASTLVLIWSKRGRLNHRSVFKKCGHFSNHFFICVLYLRFRG